MAEPMRVLFVLGSMGGGGSERQVVEILRGLHRDRFAPSLYLIYRTGDLLDEIPSDVPIYSFGDQPAVPSFNFPGRLLLAQGRELAKLIQVQQIDLVYDRTSQMTLTAYLARRSRHVARVSVAAGDPQREFASAHYRFSLAKRLLLRRAYRDADRVVAVSDGVARGLISFFQLPEKKVITCYNMFDVARIESLSREALPPLEADWFHVVSVGRLQSEKGHVHLLRAIDELVHHRGRDRVRLSLIGQGPSEPELRAFVADRQLESHVQFLGFLKNPLPWVRKAHLFCLPSLYEGMPNALVEAMLCGTPVLATDCPSGPREILLGEQLGRLVPAGNAMALADALADAERNYAAWQVTATAARQHATRTFSVEQGMQRLETLFTSVLRERRASPCREQEK